MNIARKRTTVLAALAVLLVAAACSGNDDNRPASGESRSSTGGGAPPGATGIDFAAPSSIKSADAAFNYSALVWQGYWLSRDQFGPFVMASGAGIPFEPPMDVLQAGMAMVAQNPADAEMLPQNMLPLQAVFASTSSKLVNDPRSFDPLDFGGLRLDPASFDRTVSVRAQAETMLKESQWAHNFADAHFGDPKGSFGAQQRFMGLMVNMLAQMQGQYAMQNLLKLDGLYRDSDGAVDYAGNWAMLHALSDIARLAGATDSRYANADAARAFDSAATALCRALENRKPSGPRESALAVRALIYRAWSTKDAGLKESALKQAKTIADGLIGTPSTDVVTASAAIAALASEATVDGDGRYRSAADALFKRLSDDFDAGNGVFRSKSKYDVDDVAWIVGGLNALVQQGGASTKGPASRMLLAFYESTMSVAGLQLSAPPGKDGAMAGQFEKDLPSVVYYHPTKTPAPPAAGRLTVPAEEITWDGTAWTVTSDRFVVAGAMHLANELNWLGPHLGSVPFPFQQSIDAQPPRQSSGAPSGNNLTLTAQGIKFDKTSFAASAGQEVTITYDNKDAGVPHNLHVQAGAAGDFKTDIQTGRAKQTLTFTITQPGSYTFVCDVHPADMRGTLTVK